MSDRLFKSYFDLHLLSVCIIRPGSKITGRGIYDFSIMICNTLIFYHFFQDVYMTNNNKTDFNSTDIYPPYRMTCKGGSITDKAGFIILTAYRPTFAQLVYTLSLKPSLSFIFGKLSTAL